MNVRLPLALAGFVALGLVACGGDDGGGGGSAASSVAEACTNAGNAYGSKTGQCDGVLAPSATDGAAAVTALCNATAAASGVGYTPANVQACADAITADSCDEIIAHGLPSACSIPGSLANGAACGADSQCQSAFCPHGRDTCGTCAAMPAEGGACVNGQCPMSMNCEAGACVTKRGAGAGCTDSTPCAGGFACVSGTCQTAMAGTQCDKIGDICNLTEPSVCNGQKVCEKLTVANPGEACGIVQKVVCGGGATCTKDSMGTCALPKSNGQACASSDDCESLLACIGGTCQTFDPATCK